jgi:hypothetical protein
MELPIRLPHAQQGKPNRIWRLGPAGRGGAQQTRIVPRSSPGSPLCHLFWACCGRRGRDPHPPIPLWSLAPSMHRIDLVVFTSMSGMCPTRTLNQCGIMKNTSLSMSTPICNGQPLPSPKLQIWRNYAVSPSPLLPFKQTRIADAELGSRCFEICGRRCVGD